MTKACGFKGAATMDPILTRNPKNKKFRKMDKRKMVAYQRHRGMKYQTMDEKG